MNSLINYVLYKCLTIIGQIGNQTDTETLGIVGAINKNLWKSTNEQGYLNTAIDCYKKGWNLYKDYYNNVKIMPIAFRTKVRFRTRQ